MLAGRIKANDVAFDDDRVGGRIVLVNNAPASLPEMTLPSPVPGVGVSPPTVHEPYWSQTPTNVAVERATSPVMSVPM